MADSHATGQHEREGAERRPPPSPAPVPELDDARKESGTFQALAAPLLAAPPDGATTRPAVDLRRLPSVGLRRQFVVGLGRRQANAHLRRVLAPDPVEPAAIAEAPSTRVGLQDESPLPPALLAESDSPASGQTTDAGLDGPAPISRAVADVAENPEDVHPLFAETAGQQGDVGLSLSPDRAGSEVARRKTTGLPPPVDGRRMRCAQRVTTAGLLVIARTPVLAPPSEPTHASGALTAWTMRGPPPTEAHIAAVRHPVAPSDDRPSPGRVGVSPNVAGSMPPDVRAAATVRRVPLGGVPSPALRRTCACGGTVGPDGECDACRAKRQALQRRIDRENERPARVKSAPREAPKMVSADVSKAIRTACDARCGPLIGGASYGETECEFGGNGEPTGTVLVTVTDTDPCTRPCVDKHEATHAVTMTPVCSELRACTKKAGQNEAALTKCEDAYVTMLFATAPGTECAAYKAEVECLRGRQSRPDCASKDAKPRLAKRLRGAECYRDCFCTAVAAGAAPKAKR